MAASFFVNLASHGRSALSSLSGCRTCFSGICLGDHYSNLLSFRKLGGGPRDCYNRIRKMQGLKHREPTFERSCWDGSLEGLLNGRRKGLHSFSKLQMTFTTGCERNIRIYGALENAIRTYGSAAKSESEDDYEDNSRKSNILSGNAMTDVEDSAGSQSEDEEFSQPNHRSGSKWSWKQKIPSKGGLVDAESEGDDYNHANKKGLANVRSSKRKTSAKEVFADSDSEEVAENYSEERKVSFSSLRGSNRKVASNGNKREPVKAFSRDDFDNFWRKPGDSESEDESDELLQQTKKLTCSAESTERKMATKEIMPNGKTAAQDNRLNGKSAVKGNRRDVVDSESEEEFEDLWQESEKPSGSLRSSNRKMPAEDHRPKGKGATKHSKLDLASSESDEEFVELWQERKKSLGDVRSSKRKISAEDTRADSAVKRRKGAAKDDDDRLPFTQPSKDMDSNTSHLSERRFDEFDISACSVRALHTIFKYERMTPVQEATFPIILEGKDVLAKARTGTGKTIAFLLPAIEVILEAQSNRRDRYNSINVLVVCPTRELAQQACKEATTLLSYHDGMGAQVVIGGNKIGKEQKSLHCDPCQILVGTPGRLVDHIKRTPHFRDQLRTVKLFVLDEADHMLDMGFRKSLEQIMSALPARRQTLMFSATIPEEVHRISKVALRVDHDFIDAVGKDNTETHAKVKQQCIVVPTEKHLALLYHVLKDHMNHEPDYKVLVFCTTARVTALLAELFKELGFNSKEIHSRKTQDQRTRVSNEFRKSKGAIILFTSDVSARGVDYPNVTLVIQVGIPSEREQYIHRLGRTGRAGKEGEGVLLLAPWENSFLNKVKDLPIQQVAPPRLDSKIESMILSKSANIDKNVRSQAYNAWLGYYKSVKGISLDAESLFHHAKEFSVSIGFIKPPDLSRGLLAKMGLGKSQGIRGNARRR